MRSAELERSHFVRVQADTRAIFDSARRLPDQVFQREYRRFCFVDFDTMLGARFWSLLAEYARAFGDANIYFSVLDPDPEADDFPACHSHGFACWSASDSAEAYVGRLSEASDIADAFANVVKVGCWWGDSRQWGFWGDRSRGIGIGGRASAARGHWRIYTGVGCFELEDALETLVWGTFRDRPSFKLFEHIFVENYATSAPLSDQTECARRE
jgi:hypothetical protein